MAPSDCMKLLLKLTAFLISVFSTSITMQCPPKNAEGGDYVIRNVGIKLCQLKCSESGQCLSVEYDIETLTCRLSSAESKIKKKGGHVNLASVHSHVPTGSCTSSMCSFGQRCLKTRSGKAVCVQEKNYNDPEVSPQHKVDKQETFANNPLHEACRKGDLNLVRRIVSRVLVNSRDEKHGRTPLMVAAQEGHCRIFDFLISKGANKSDVDNDCKNVLHWACKSGHAIIVDCVLPRYGIVKNARASPLIQAARQRKSDVFEFLVCTGSDVSKVYRDGSNILHHASFGGSMSIVKYIVSQGNGDINSRRQDGKNPLMMAAMAGTIEVFKFLVSVGGNPSHVENNGRNILHLASSFGRVEIVKHILSQNLVDINARDRYGKTAAMMAKLRTPPKVYNILVSWGCPVK